MTCLSLRSTFVSGTATLLMLLLSGSDMTMARLGERKLQKGSGKGLCKLIEFTRELELGPTLVPLGGSPSSESAIVLVTQKSKLCVGPKFNPCDGGEEIGTVEATATLVGPPTDPTNSRIGQGGYVLNSAEYGTGTILFESVVTNEDAMMNDFEVSIIGGTGDFRCAEGWIKVGKAYRNDPPGAEEKPKRPVTVNICPGDCKDVTVPV